MMEPSSTKKKEFECLHCPFKDRRKATFEKHNACHNRDPAAKYQCAFCSYSIHNPVKLLLHVKLHSEDISKENNKNIGDRDQSNSATPSKRKEVQWHVYPDGTRKRYKLCDDCGYKTLKNKSLYSHIKVWHPQSVTTASKPGSTTNQSKAAPAKRKAEIWHILPSGKRKRRKLSHDCDYHTLHQSSLDRHIELLHPVTATTAAGTTATKEKCNCIDDHQNAEKDDGTLPVELWHPIATTTAAGTATRKETFNNIDEHQNTEKVDDVSLDKNSTSSQARKQFDVEECRVSLHDVHYSSNARENPESSLNVLEEVPEEQIPFQGPDQTADVDELEDGTIQSLRSQLVVWKETSRIAEDQMGVIFLKKVDNQEKINEVGRAKMKMELNLRTEQRILLEICISAQDAGEDHRKFTQPMEEKVKSLTEKMDELDSQFKALKQEDKSLAEDLAFAQGAHLGVIQVIDALFSELDGRNC